MRCSQNPYAAEAVPPMIDPGMSMMAPSTTFTPGGISGNLIQINPAQVMVDQYGQQLDMQPVMQQSMFNSQVALQQGYDYQQSVQAVYSQVRARITVAAAVKCAAWIVCMAVCLFMPRYFQICAYEPELGQQLFRIRLE